MHDHIERKHDERSDAQRQSSALEASQAPGARRRDDDHTGENDGGDLRYAEVTRSQGHADEFRDNGEGVEHEEIDHAERAPELPETLEDQTGMAHPRHRTEAEHHLLGHIQHRDQQQQYPEQVRTEILTGLRVGGDAAGVVVAHHDDEAGADDGEQGEQLGLGRAPCGGVAVGDGSEGAFDVADVLLIEDGTEIARIHDTALFGVGSRHENVAPLVGPLPTMGASEVARSVIVSLPSSSDGSCRPGHDGAPTRRTRCGSEDDLPRRGRAGDGPQDGSVTAPLALPSGAPENRRASTPAESALLVCQRALRDGGRRLLGGSDFTGPPPLVDTDARRPL